MKDRFITIKISSRQVEGIRDGYQCVVEELEKENLSVDNDAHDYLLYTHAIEMRNRFETQLGKGQQTNTMKFSLSEVVGFYQLWQKEFALTPYSGTAVGSMFSMINQKHVSAQWILERPKKDFPITLPARRRQ